MFYYVSRLEEYDDIKCDTFAKAYKLFLNDPLYLSIEMIDEYNNTVLFRNDQLEITFNEKHKRYLDFKRMASNIDNINRSLFY